MIGKLSQKPSLKMKGQIIHTLTKIKKKKKKEKTPQVSILVDIVAILLFSLKAFVLYHINSDGLIFGGLNFEMTYALYL